MTNTRMNGTSLRVLLIDDSLDLVDMLARLFRASGYEADFADESAMASPETILARVESARPNVVVMDLTLPGCDTFEAIRLLRSRFPQCPVIAYSGYDDADTVHQACQAGAIELVSKLGDPHAIVEAVERVAVPS